MVLPVALRWWPWEPWGGPGLLFPRKLRILAPFRAPRLTSSLLSRSNRPFCSMPWRSAGRVVMATFGFGRNLTVPLTIRRLSFTRHIVECLNC